MKRAILYELNDSPSGGHPPAKRTMARVVHVDVLQKASTPSPLQQGPLNVGHEPEDAEGEEYIVEKISDVKLAPFGRKRGLRLRISRSLCRLSKAGMVFTF